MTGVIQTSILVGGGLAGLFLILLAMPHSKLRDMLMPVIGWAFAIFCGIYMISPVDILPEAVLGPFGLVDDAGAIFAGFCAARAAMKAGKQQQPAA